MIKIEQRDHCQCSRRDFIKKTITGAGTIALGSFSVSLIDGCSGTGTKMLGTYASATPGSDAASIIVDMSKTENQTLAKIGDTLALGASDVDSKGILLYRESERTVKAYSRECTHQQCTVGPFISGVSSCPCHSSRFNLSGDNISGPAPMPLYQYTTSVQGNITTINDKKT
jgi:cytochrome b6-f complex iron-sulfur subunit